MSGPFRLILSPKCASPLSPIHRHLGKSLIGREELNNQKHFIKKLEYVPAPSKSHFTNLCDIRYDNPHLGEIQLTVPDIHKCENRGLLVNTPQKNNILKNGLSEKGDLNILGRGTFGTVVQGVYKSRDVAVKVIKHGAKKNKKLRESNILNLSHVNVVKILDVITNQNQSHAMIIMEHLGNSKQLQSILDDKNFELKEENIAKFALDISRGLSFCHENDILHLDVKPSNIIVCEDGTCKLCDFGSCFKMNVEVKAEPYIHQGTVAFTAPEILLGKEPTIKSDVYSFGILLWQMVHRQIPYGDIDRSEIIIYKVVKFGLRPSCSIRSNFGMLYRQCWLAIPDDRPDMQTVINLLCLV